MATCASSPPAWTATTSWPAAPVLVEVDGEILPVRCADLALIVRSKQAADRPQNRQVLGLLVSQLQERDSRRRDGRHGGLGYL